MKKFSFFLIIFGLFSACVGYTPTTNDLAQVKGLKAQLETITTGNNKDKRSFYAQIKSLQKQFPQDERLQYFLSELGNAMLLPINTEKVKVKATNKQFKIDFLSGYMAGLKEITDPDTCTWRYNTMDTISFANNFPTALTIATRYRETNCGYYLPNNGDGPFQILSKEYGSGAITDDVFMQSIQDFIDFSKAKYQQYKSKLWITLSYTWLDRTGIINHGGLYNGWIISWNIVNPLNPHYLRDGYGSEYSGAIRYGLMPKFLKVLDWEVKNTY